MHCIASPIPASLGSLLCVSVSDWADVDRVSVVIAACRRASTVHTASHQPPSLNPFSHVVMA